MFVQTADRGHGLQAVSRIASGSLVIEYCGEVISHEECYRRLSSYDLLGVHDFYMMELSSSLMIDARQLGNAARFINHSCAPNCHTQVWSVGSQQRVGIFALRDIEQGEEISYNYRAQTFNARGQHNNVVQACRCGAANCSSFLGEKPTAVTKEKESAKRKRRATDTDNTRSARATKVHSGSCGGKKSAVSGTHKAAVAASGQDRPVAQTKSTGFGHGPPRRRAVKKEQRRADSDETEDEDDAVAEPAPAKMDSVVGRDEARMEQQQQRRHDAAAEGQESVESFAHAGQQTAVGELVEKSIEAAHDTDDEETELDSNTSSLSAPASPSSASHLSTSSLDVPDFDGHTTLSPSSVAVPLPLLIVKSLVGMHSAPSPLGCEVAMQSEVGVR